MNQSLNVSTVLDPGEVVDRIRSQILITRVGLWLLPADCLGNEENEAARLIIASLDMSKLLIENLPADTSFVGIGIDTILMLLDQAVDRATMDCCLIYNFDLLISRLDHENRHALWRQLWGGFPHRKRALLITMPDQATNLLPPPETLKQWRSERRLAGEIR
jgi:hypothetical protein